MKFQPGHLETRDVKLQSQVPEVQKFTKGVAWDPLSGLLGPHHSFWSGIKRGSVWRFL